MAVTPGTHEAGRQGDASSPAEVRIHETRIESVAFSPDGRSGASTSRDGDLKVWKLPPRNELIAKAKKSICGYSSVAFSPDGRTLAAGGLDGRVSLIEAASGRERATHPASSCSIRAVAFSPAGDRVSAAGDDAIIRTWDVASGREESPMPGHSGPIRTLAYSPDGGALASAGADHLIHLWDPISRRLLARFDPGCGPVWSVDFAADGRSLAVGGVEGIAVLEIPGGRSVLRLGLPSPVTAVRFCLGGAALAFSTLDGDIELQGLTGGQALRRRRVAVTPGRVKALAASPDGSTLVTGSDDASLRVYDLLEAH